MSSLMGIPLAVLGSTGTVGENTLEVLAQKKHGKKFKVVSLAARSKVKKLAEQCATWQPRKVAVGTPAAAKELKQLLDKKQSQSESEKPEILCGEEGMEELVADAKTDWVVNALGGGAGLKPSIAALKSGKCLLLANKESLVSAGSLLMEAAQRNRGVILPLDSEHNAILRCMPADYCIGKDPKGVCPGLRQIVLTASGGPFLDYDPKKLKDVTPEQATAHPVWQMGDKISVDSASMMNKGLEILEASVLFAVSEERIKVIIHPQSIIHCMLEFTDGSALAQLSKPDMKIVIHQALCYPNYEPLENPPPLSLSELSFREIKEKEFPCLELARHAAREKGALPAVMSEADDAAVAAFLRRQITFDKIPTVVEKAMNRFAQEPQPESVPEVLALIQSAKEYSLSVLNKC